jgi:hypothetical protein
MAQDAMVKETALASAVAFIAKKAAMAVVLIVVLIVVRPAV